MNCLLCIVYNLLFFFLSIFFSLLFQGAHIVSLDTLTEEKDKAEEIEVKRNQHGIVRGHLHKPYKKMLNLDDPVLFKEIIYITDALVDSC